MTFRQFAYRNILRNKRTYAAFLLSCAFSVFVFFVYAVFVFHPSVEDGNITTLAVSGMMVSQIVIFSFSFLFVLYSMSSFLSFRKQEFGLLILHGLTKRRLRKLLFFENTFIGFGAILIGISLGLAFEKLFLMAVSRIILFDEMPFYMPWKALGLTILSFTLLFITISFFTSFVVRTSKVVDLLKGSMKPKSSPTASKFLSGLAILLIGYGYWLSISAQEEQVVFRFIPVTFIVIVGTYFLFTQLSVFMMKWLQRNPDKNWKGTRLISRSNLMYRIKDNARIFFLVSIVSTIAICATGTIATFGVWGERDFETPLAMTYVSYNHEEANRDNQELVRELNDAEINYDLYQFTIKVVETEAYDAELDTVYEQIYNIVSQDDYNELAKLSGFPTYELNENQVLPTHNSFLSIKELPLSSGRERAVTTLEAPEENLFTMLYSMNPIVVSNELYNQIHMDDNQIFYGYNIDDWQSTEFIGYQIEQKQIKRSQEVYGDGQPLIRMFNFNSSGLRYILTISMYQTMLFMGSVIGVVFFIATGSFLYYRIQNYLPQDAARFATLRKLGLSYKKMRQIVTAEMMILFFGPFIVSLIHSAVAFVALQSMIIERPNILIHVLVVISGFVFAQFIYFLLMRKQYLNSLMRMIEKS
ncbi:ABC transporter permease [Alkalicoccobacillus porphyridii]|uniref:ABC transporter permease n=1 Tax=Alkalicoccobacillus porphyridii TaxID=2597270 RepID=UPI00163D840F|nr:ABC transporter permease [Alkalicoccobacillus porphyridii]